ncbi:MAG: glycosyltransferase family 4 protein [Flavisolibacter sp.]
MKVAFISRPTLYTVPGGDTVQMEETAQHLKEFDVEARILLSHQEINYKEFDLLHFFNLTRPADILFHINKSNVPFVISPILVDYTEFDIRHRRGLSGWMLRSVPSPEYTKTLARWLLLKDKLPAKEYLWKGHRKAISEILQKAKMLLPNSIQESKQLEKSYPCAKTQSVIPNGINEKLFYRDGSVQKQQALVVCAARIEGLKNQLNLIKALNNTAFTLVLVGQAAPNQQRYYRHCKTIAKRNIVFTGPLDQPRLASLFRRAKVHVLPSWFETCGLASLEAAVSGCNIVATEKGFASEYLGSHAFYCDPGSIDSIYNAVSLAANSDRSNELHDKIVNQFTWRHAAKKTVEAYESCLNN